MSSVGAAPRGARTARQPRRHPGEQCPRRSQPQERREVARAQDPRGQGALGAKCAEARHARLEIRRAAGRGWRRVSGARERAVRGAGSGRRPAARARAPGRDRRLAPCPRRPHGGRAVRVRRWDNAGLGIALIRDGNGTRSFDTLLRYRGAAMAEFWRALKTLKALQAEQARSAAAAAPRPARRPCRACGAHTRRPGRRASDLAPTERTRAPHGIPAARAAHRRPCPARARRARNAERTRPAPGETGARGHEGSRAEILVASERMQPFNLGVSCHAGIAERKEEPVRLRRDRPPPTVSRFGTPGSGQRRVRRWRAA